MEWSGEEGDPPLEDPAWDRLLFLLALLPGLLASAAILFLLDLIERALIR